MTYFTKSKSGHYLKKDARRAIVNVCSLSMQNVIHISPTQPCGKSEAHYTADIIYPNISKIVKAFSEIYVRVVH